MPGPKPTTSGRVNSTFSARRFSTCASNEPTASSKTPPGFGKYGVTSPASRRSSANGAAPRPEEEFNVETGPSGCGRQRRLRKDGDRSGGASRDAPHLQEIRHAFEEICSA